MYSKRILMLGAKFKGRIEKVLLDGALDYVNYNEERLALEIFCEHISEYDVVLIGAELEEIQQLALDMGFDINGAPFKYLPALVTSDN